MMSVVSDRHTNRPFCRRMIPDSLLSRRPSRPLAAWLAGRIDWPRYAALAERLAGETSLVGGRNPTLLVFELDPAITIGRQGSRADVALSDHDLASRQMPLRFTGRGGGAIVHGPGQVCVSLFASLEDLGLGRHDVGGYLERFESGLAEALRTLKVGPVRHAGRPGLFGRTGLVAAIGVAVRRGGVSHGGFINVSPALDLAHRVTTMWLSAPSHAAKPVTMSSVEADIQRRVRLQDARTAVVEALANAFGFEAPHIHAGFPVAPAALGPRPTEPVTRVG
jgi:lipoyl(octanoyl) transferase